MPDQPPMPPTTQDFPDHWGFISYRPSIDSMTRLMPCGATKNARPTICAKIFMHWMPRLIKRWMR